MNVNTNPAAAVDPVLARLSASIAATREEPAVERTNAIKKLQASAKGLPTTSTAAVAKAASPATAATRAIDADQPLTIDGLKQAWGSADTQYDLDGSGTVDMKDLLMLLSKLAHAPEAPDGPPSELSPHHLDAPRETTADTLEPGHVEPTDDELTVEGLKAAWGASDSHYDLNADGTVDMRDLMQLLSQLHTASRQTPADPPAHDPGTGDNELTVKGLGAAWGESDSVYDLDGDGTVGMADLMQLLSQLHARGANEDDNRPVTGSRLEATGDVTASIDPGVADDPGAMTVKELLESWGAEGSRYDLDQDGVVNMSDLLMLLSKLRHDHPELTNNRAALATAIPNNALGAPDGNETPRDRETRVSAITASLVDRFESAGLFETPPSNLHDLLDQLELSNTDRKTLLSQLNRAYPSGLGISIDA